jgi:hypothetical protein
MDVFSSSTWMLFRVSLINFKYGPFSNIAQSRSNSRFHSYLKSIGRDSLFCLDYPFTDGSLSEYHTQMNHVLTVFPYSSCPRNIPNGNWSSRFPRYLKSIGRDSLFCLDYLFRRNQYKALILLITYRIHYLLPTHSATQFHPAINNVLSLFLFLLQATNLPLPTPE